MLSTIEPVVYAVGASVRIVHSRHGTNPTSVTAPAPKEQRPPARVPQRKAERDSENDRDLDHPLQLRRRCGSSEDTHQPEGGRAPLRDPEPCGDRGEHQEDRERHVGVRGEPSRRRPSASRRSRAPPTTRAAARRAGGAARRATRRTRRGGARTRGGRHGRRRRSGTQTPPGRARTAGSRGATGRTRGCAKAVVSRPSSSTSAMAFGVHWVHASHEERGWYNASTARRISGNATRSAATHSSLVSPSLRPRALGGARRRAPAEASSAQSMSV